MCVWAPLRGAVVSRLLCNGLGDFPGQLGLVAQENVQCLTSLAGRKHYGLGIVLEHIDPVGNVWSVVFADLRLMAQVSHCECRSNLRDQLLHRVAFIAEFAQAQVPLASVSGPVD